MPSIKLNSDEIRSRISERKTAIHVRTQGNDAISRALKESLSQCSCIITSSKCCNCCCICTGCWVVDGVDCCYSVNPDCINPDCGCSTCTVVQWESWWTELDPFNKPICQIGFKFTATSYGQTSSFGYILSTANSQSICTDPITGLPLSEPPTWGYLNVPGAFGPPGVGNQLMIPVPDCTGNIGWSLTGVPTWFTSIPPLDCYHFKGTTNIVNGPLNGDFSGLGCFVGAPYYTQNENNINCQVTINQGPQPCCNTSGGPDGPCSFGLANDDGPCNDSLRRRTTRKILRPATITKTTLPETLQTNFNPQEILWLLPAYKNPVETDWALSNIRKNYPQSKIMLVNEGDEKSPWQIVANRNNAILKNQPRMKEIKYGGQVWAERLKYFLENTDAKYLFKIDADIKVNSIFPYLPNADIFTNLPPNYPFSVFDGFVGITRETAEIMSENKYFNDPKFTDTTYLKQIRGINKGMIVEDAILDAVVKKFGFTVMNFPECLMFNDGEEDVSSDLTKKFSITHPHRKLSA